MVFKCGEEKNQQQTVHDGYETRQEILFQRSISFAHEAAPPTIR